MKWFCFSYPEVHSKWTMKSCARRCRNWSRLEKSSEIPSSECDLSVIAIMAASILGRIYLFVCVELFCRDFFIFSAWLIDLTQNNFGTTRRQKSFVKLEIWSQNIHHCTMMKLMPYVDETWPFQGSRDNYKKGRRATFQVGNIYNCDAEYHIGDFLFISWPIFFF